VVVDALSHKAHYNYLSAISLTWEECSVLVQPDMAQYNVTLTLMLRGEITAAQSRDDGASHIKRRLTEGDPKVDVSAYMMKALYGSRTIWWFQRTRSCARRYLIWWT
jgi:hypothetical protein